MQVIRNRLNSVVLVLIALMMAGALARGVLGGPLDPPAPPGSTLPQVEPRSPIPPAGWDGTTFPIVISQPGSYYLTRDITGVSGKDGISITTYDVTLDMNGFILKGVLGSGDGIVSCCLGTTVKNGSVVYWGGAGLNLGMKALMSSVNAHNNAGNGITSGASALVVDSVAKNNGGYGILVAGGIIRGNQVETNGGAGIFVTGTGVIDGNDVQFNSGVGIDVFDVGAAVENNVLNGNAAGGIRVDGWGNRIDGNNAVGDNYISVPFGIRVTGTHNIIVRNSATYNVDNFDIAAGNTAGPEETSAATSPWSNVNY